eukprot:11350781-Alexandrium_andersonii.AAC.1
MSIRMFDAVADPLAHHRITLRFLQAGSLLRQQLNMLLSGSSLRDLGELESEVAKLAMVPVVERIIEARASGVRHAIMRRSHGRSSGVRASLTLRLPELMR